jgi:DNA-binding CsgD family transcriptional regulator
MRRTVQGEDGGATPHERLLAHALDTVAALVEASAALGFTVDVHQTIERLVVRCPRAEDAAMVAPLAARLPDIEPIDPFSPRRAEAACATVMSAADAGGDEVVAASMYGRHLRRFGFLPPVVMFFRRAGLVDSGIVLLRTLGAPPFDGHAVRLLGEWQPLLESALTLPAGTPAPPLEVPAGPPLTTREAQVAALVAQGSSNAAVAAALGMSEATVKTHLTKVYAKLGVRTRTQLALTLPRAPVLDDAATELVLT